MRFAFCDYKQGPHFFRNQGCTIILMVWYGPSFLSPVLMIKPLHFKNTIVRIRKLRSHVCGPIKDKHTYSKIFQLQLVILVQVIM